MSETSGLSELLRLIREETLSDQSLKTPSNNPDVDLQSCMTGRDLMVSIVNMSNEPLIPFGKSIIKKEKRRWTLT